MALGQMIDGMHFRGMLANEAAADAVLSAPGQLGDFYLDIGAACFRFHDGTEWRSNTDAAFLKGEELNNASASLGDALVFSGTKWESTKPKNPDFFHVSSLSNGYALSGYQPIGESTNGPGYVYIPGYLGQNWSIVTDLEIVGIKKAAAETTETVDVEYGGIWNGESRNNHVGSGTVVTGTGAAGTFWKASIKSLLPSLGSMDAYSVRVKSSDAQYILGVRQVYQAKKWS